MVVAAGLAGARAGGIAGAGSGGKGTGSAGTNADTGAVGGFSRRNRAVVLYLNIDDQDCTDLLRITTSWEHKMVMSKSSETTWVMRNDRMNLLNDPRCWINKIWKFRFGFLNDLSPIITGVVREIAPVYEAKCVVTFKLFDCSLNMSQTTSGKNWGTVPSSFIAEQIGKKHGFKTVIDPSDDKGKKAFIQPANVNDIQYLRDIAANIDYEVFVDNTPPTLYYRKKPYGSPPAGRLIYYYDNSEFANMKSFKPKVKGLGPLKTSSSGASSDKDKDKKKGEAQDDDSDGLAGFYTIGGANGNVESVTNGRSEDVDAGTGTDLGKLADSAKQAMGLPSTANAGVAGGKAGGDAEKAAVNKPASTDDNPAALAKAARSAQLDKTNEADSTHLLMPSLQKGQVYEIQGVDAGLAGRWYPEEITHKITGKDLGTDVKWKRNSKNKDGSKEAKDAKGNVGAGVAGGQGGGSERVEDVTVNAG